MALLLAFAITLVIAVLISGLAEETVLSVSVLFLAAGFLIGSHFLGGMPRVHSNLLEPLAEVALFSVLFTDGMKTGGFARIRESWRLPARALIIGMPLTILGIALLAHWMAAVDWPKAFLIAAALSPTDPVFVSAIFRFEAVPEPVKRLLNLESGLNDGISLPIVMLLLASSGVRAQSPGIMLEDLALGIAIGFVIPWVAIRLEKLPFFHATGLFHPLNAFALGLLVLAVCYVVGANLFLAGFGAGIAVATFGSSFSESFREFGELVTELLKLAALLAFGAMISPTFFTPLPGWEYVFIAMAVFAVRPVAIWIALLGCGLSTSEKLAAGWFGPKGFASVVYGIFIYESGFRHLGHLIALAVAASIVVYSSTDILVGRWFQRRRQLHAPPAPQPGGAPE